jgi:hypothetical protein
MKKSLIVVLFLVAMDAWGQSYWVYDRQWGGFIDYKGSGRFRFDDAVDLHDNWSEGEFQRIERPSNEQINVIKYGLRQYTVRVNDVYCLTFTNDLTKRRYVAYVIITAFTSGDGYTFSYGLWEGVSRRY